MALSLLYTISARIARGNFSFLPGAFAAGGGKGELFLFGSPGTSRPRPPRVLLSRDKSTQKHAQTNGLRILAYRLTAILHLFCAAI